MVLCGYTVVLIGFDWFPGGVVLVICEFGCWVGLVQLAG